MSTYIEFFAAPDDDAAAAVRNQGPSAKYPFVAANDLHFDADDAVLAWRNLMTGRTGLTVSDWDDLRFVAEFQNDGSAVFTVPDELVVMLIEAAPHRLREVAAAWVPAAAADGSEISEQAAADLISGIAGLARAAAGTENRLYCWVAV